MTTVSRRRFHQALAATAALFTAGGLAFPSSAHAEPEDCVETLSMYDPYDLVTDTDLSVDYDTLVDVESLVDDYTSRIDDAVDAEFEDDEPPDDVSSDELIDEGRWEIDDAVELGRSIAGCED
jgi:hypothetical protein